MVAPACPRLPSKTASFPAATAHASKPASSPASAAAASRKKSPSAKISPKAVSASAAAINTPKAPASKSPSPSPPAPARSSSPSASSSPKPSPPPASSATAPPTSSPPSTLSKSLFLCRWFQNVGFPLVLGLDDLPSRPPTEGIGFPGDQQLQATRRVPQVRSLNLGLGVAFSSHSSTSITTSPGIPR